MSSMAQTACATAQKSCFRVKRPRRRWHPKRAAAGALEEQVGAGAILSRALAGIAYNASGRGKPAFAMPGSTKAVDLAMTRPILPELRHILWELRK